MNAVGSAAGGSRVAGPHGTGSPRNRWHSLVGECARQPSQPRSQGPRGGRSRPRVPRRIRGAPPPAATRRLRSRAPSRPAATIDRQAADGGFPIDRSLRL